ncbi:glutathione transferase GstA [Montanilutibacter psychrotolerans]|uniref:Glutathione transferase GstA n=1 Tax=Montanilutibacter psychrotolerans TaxID=1327343 RepID=A0A3M8SY31_9GAMM|nr:glutathione transferase GstA [Lysobacter psychrotolerans]RNF86247.1 glutathione transferase GstA [Lysobacter psychrotolerans]
MKLYFAPHTCSLAPHILLHELGIPFELARVQLGPAPTVLSTGEDYRKVNPLGYVPALELDAGRVLTEGTAILQWLADSSPDSPLATPADVHQRYELQRWLGYIGSELHKTFSPWLFHPEYGEQAMNVARVRLNPRLDVVERQLQRHAFIAGDTFTVADAYLFAVVSWCKPLKISLQPWPALAGYLERLGQRDSIRAALAAEKRALAA